MERIVIQELERTLKITREGVLSYSDSGLAQMGKLIQSASLSIALETHSRELEAMKMPVLA